MKTSLLKFLLDIAMINHRRPWLKYVIVLGIIAVIAGYVIWKADSRIYYYKDWDDNIGVADKCWVNEHGLICDRKYGGKIQVKEFWYTEG